MKRIALVGDSNADVVAHQAIPQALKIACESLNVELDATWLHTTAVLSTDLSAYDGIWCVPASPYASMAGALAAIRYARENKLPFLGTCGGYQHAALEFAQHVLGHLTAANAEVDADAAMPLISPLLCRLIDTADTIDLRAGSQVAGLYGQLNIEEQYHCGFGVNQHYLPLFDDSDFQFVGFDQEGDPRVFELSYHPFFIGTAYQPERAALKGENHALIAAFVGAIHSQ